MGEDYDTSKATHYICVCGHDWWHGPGVGVAAFEHVPDDPDGWEADDPGVVW